jgi:hypothetical protein
VRHAYHFSLIPTTPGNPSARLTCAQRQRQVDGNFAQRAAPATPRLQLAPDLHPAQQLDRTLSEIAERFGPARSKWVIDGIGIRRNSALIELSFTAPSRFAKETRS